MLVMIHNILMVIKSSIKTRLTQPSEINFNAINLNQGMNNTLSCNFSYPQSLAVKYGYCPHCMQYAIMYVEGVFTLLYLSAEGVCTTDASRLSPKQRSDVTDDYDSEGEDFDGFYDVS